MSNAVSMEQKCACGRPLHYTDPSLRKAVELLIAEKGSTIDVTVDGHTWQVPRHFIALHGVKADELPLLSSLLGFQEVR